MSASRTELAMAATRDGRHVTGYTRAPLVRRLRGLRGRVSFQFPVLRVGSLGRGILGRGILWRWAADGKRKWARVT